MICLATTSSHGFVDIITDFIKANDNLVMRGEIRNQFDLLK